MPGARKDVTPVAIDNPIYTGRVAELGDNYTVVFEETFEAGDVFYSPPGHLPLAAPCTELITFSPTSELAKVNAVIAKNQAEVAAARL
jgi:hypothetical protein